MRRASQTHKESSTSSRPQPRARDEKKVSTSNTTAESKPKTTASGEDTTMDTNTATSTTTTTTTTTIAAKAATNEDTYTKENESAIESMKESQENQAETTESTNTAQGEESTSNKRNFSDICEGGDDGAGIDEENRRKKRKDDGGKDGKTTTQRNQSQSKGQGGKQPSGQSKSSTCAAKAATTNERKSPSPKPTTSGDSEVEDGKSDLKVPPLKIVIPQSTSNEQEIGTSRNGKSSHSQRTHPLPYVVPSGDSNDNNSLTGGTNSPPENNTPSTNKDQDKNKDSANTSSTGAQDDQRALTGHQRVLRSSHRGSSSAVTTTASSTQQQSTTTDRGSNNSSPQLQRSHSPSPSASPATLIQGDVPATSSAASTTSSSCSSNTKTTDNQANTSEPDTAVSAATVPATTSSSSSSSNSSSNLNQPTVELHPRKRKMKQGNKEVNQNSIESQDHQPAEAQIHPHDQPITNCYQLYLNIRKQIDKRRRGLFPVQPKPPQGFKDYLMNRCTYVLAGSGLSTPTITYPPTLPVPMKDLFTEQEKERYRLRMQHVIEKEKLVLAVEQEILRVHGRAARALANQSLPFSVCTILRDEEVYNLITPEQEEKDRNARSRYNGRLFLSWLQDVDDKWEKIKEHMLLRHHNEAESLHAVQKMDWEWKLKELNLCDRKSTPSIDEHQVPMVHVSDDFDLLPA